MRKVIQTEAAPAAIGSYSQAICAGNTIYLAGQIPLDPKTMTIVAGGIQAEVEQVFKNIQAVVEAANATMDDIVKFTVYLMDLSHISFVNEAIAKCCKQPYPARTSIQVSALPKAALVEVEAVIYQN